MKAGGFLAGRPEYIIEAIEGKRYDGIHQIMPDPARSSALKTSDRSVDERAACNYIADLWRRDSMASDTVVRARIDAEVKEKAAKVLAEMGLSVSDAIRLLLVRVAVEKTLPFEVKVPNAETRAAMAELEGGGGISFDSVADLMAELNELNAKD